MVQKHGAFLDRTTPSLWGALNIMIFFSEKRNIYTSVFHMQNFRKKLHPVVGGSSYTLDADFGV